MTRCRWLSVSDGVTTRPGGRRQVTVARVASESMSRRVPTATTRPPDTARASSQPKPVRPASVAMRPLTTRSTGVRLSGIGISSEQGRQRRPLQACAQAQGQRHARLGATERAGEHGA